MSRKQGGRTDRSGGRDLLAAHLREHPWLAEVVAKNGWTEAAREPLCRGVQEQWENLPAAARPGPSDLEKAKSLH